MITEGLKGRDFIRLQDFTKAEIESMLDLSMQLKADNTMRRRHDDILAGRTLFMMFFNPSLRTRNSFEAGIFQLGGHGHFLQPEATRLPTLEGKTCPTHQNEFLMSRVSSPVWEIASLYEYWVGL